MTVLALLPIVAWLFLFAACRRSEEGWRAAALAASIIWGAAVAFSTEALSLLHAVTFPGLLTAWLSFLAAAAVMYLRTDRAADPRNNLKDLPGDLLASWKSLAPLQQLLVGLTALPVFVTLAIALLSPPNNWDSMVYHMSRVMHWLQDRSVAHYPAHIEKQLFMAPGAEYILLLFQGLTDGDRLANAVQWFSMAGSVAGASLVAKRLGAGRTGQALAALVVATLPMGIMQATNTKNDYVLAFWTVTLAYQVIVLREHAALRRALLFGGSLGLAVMTKGTSYLFAFPLVLWALAGLRQQGRAALLRLALAGLLALALNYGHYWRTTAVFGDPLARTNTAYTANETHGPGAVISNLIRNYTLHFNTGSPQLNGAALSFAAGLHDLLGLNENDPRTTLYGPFQFQSSFGHVLHEDVAGNLPHALLLLPVAAFPLALKRFRSGSLALPYLAASAAAVLFFCLLLKWQPWNSRLHLPLFVLWAPLAGCVLERLQAKRAILTVAAVLVLYALPYLVLNISRPLVSRHLAGPMHIPSVLAGTRFDAYFNNLPQLRDQMVQTALTIRERGCRQVGMDAGGSHNGEYLLWITLKEAGVWPVRIESIRVDNRSAAIPREPFSPCIAVKL